MDTRTLIAFGMLLAVLTVALLKGHARRSGGQGGPAEHRLGPHPAGTPPKGTPTLPIVLLLAGAALMLASCASVPGKTVSMGCVHPDPIDCPDPTAYPPITAMLPTKRTLGIPEPMRTDPPPPTKEQEEADRLLKRLGK